MKSNKIKIKINKKIVKNYIGTRGYVLLKKYYSKEEIDTIKKDLIVKPYIIEAYGAKAESFPIYLENDNKLYLPRYYGIQLYGKPDECRLHDGDDIKFNFIGKMREHQKKPINECLKVLQRPSENKRNWIGGGGILCLACGMGKTFDALKIISEIGKKALVICSKEFLVNQWRESIEKFMDGASIGIIQQNRIEIEGKDIVIGILQSLSMRDYDLNLFKCFGIVVYDECHLVPCKVFSKVLRKVNCLRHLGLSATPNRADGMTKILKLFIGPIIYQNTERPNADQVYVERYSFESANLAYCNEITNYRGQPMISTMINNITSYRKRTLIIIKLIKQLCEESNDRKILILSDRRNHLVEMKLLVEKEDIGTSGYYVGGMKTSDLKDSEECQIIFGTYSMASTGLDISGLNALIMASPKSNIEQSVGRILRKKHETLSPKVIDIYDNFSVFSNQAKKRLKFYHNKDYIVKTIQISETGDILDTFDNVKKMRKKKINNKKCMFSSFN